MANQPHLCPIHNLEDQFCVDCVRIVCATCLPDHNILGHVLITPEQALVITEDRRNRLEQIKGFADGRQAAAVQNIQQILDASAEIERILSATQSDIMAGSGFLPNNRYQDVSVHAQRELNVLRVVRRNDPFGSFRAWQRAERFLKEKEEWKRTEQQHGQPPLDYRNQYARCLIGNVRRDLIGQQSQIVETNITAQGSILFKAHIPRL